MGIVRISTVNKMKIRTGFVSNSSSSSFIFGYKGEKPDWRELMGRLFMIADDSMLYSIFKPIAKYIVATVDDNPIDGLSDGPRIKELVKEGFNLSYGGFDDQAGGIREGLCNEHMFHEGGKFFFWQEGGY